MNLPEPKFVCDGDWRQLSSGLVVKVWVAASLDPEERKILTADAYKHADELGYRIMMERIRHQGCTKDKCIADGRGNAMWN